MKRHAALLLLAFACFPAAASEGHRSVPVNPPKVEPTPYATVRQMVGKGQKVVMLAHPPATMTRVPVRLGYVTVRCDDAPLTPGRYDCERLDGLPTMTKVEEYLPLPQSAESWRWYLCPPTG